MSARFCTTSASMRPPDAATRLFSSGAGHGRPDPARTELLEPGRVVLWNFALSARKNKGFHGKRHGNRACAEETAGAALLDDRARLLVVQAKLEGRLADDRGADRARRGATRLSVPAQHLEQGDLRRAGEE